LETLFSGKGSSKRRRRPSFPGKDISGRRKKFPFPEKTTPNVVGRSPFPEKGSPNGVETLFSRKGSLQTTSETLISRKRNSGRRKKFPFLEKTIPNVVGKTLFWERVSLDVVKSSLGRQRQLSTSSEGPFSGKGNSRPRWKRSFLEMVSPNDVGDLIFGSGQIRTRGNFEPRNTLNTRKGTVLLSFLQFFAYFAV